MIECRMNLRYGLVAVLLLLLGAIDAKDPKSRSIRIQNESGHKLEVYWVHPQTKEKSLQSDPHVLNGATFNLNSFITHHFEVRELPGTKTGVCGGENQSCRLGYFTVNKNEDQVVYIRKGLQLEHEDSKTIAQDEAASMLAACQTKAKESIAASPEKADAIMDDLVLCIDSSTSEALEKSKSEIDFQAGVRTNMADLLETYICSDPNFNMTTPEEEHDSFQIMLDRKTIKVIMLDDFINEKECEAMEKAADFKWRKDALIGIDIPWDEKEDVIANVGRRVIDYAKKQNLDISEEGQENTLSFQSIVPGQEEHIGSDLPSCDGECADPTKVQPGNRIATMVMYCKVPTQGGAANFRNAGLHLIPKVGSAIFYSYADLETEKMDTGFSIRSACPVVEGESKIITQWLRYGVDKEHSWDSFKI